MIELNEETSRDILNSLNILIEFSKIDGSIKVSPRYLNYKYIYKKTNFRGDKVMIKALTSNIVCNSVSVIDKGIINDGVFIINEMETHLDTDQIYEFYSEFLDSLSYDDYNAVVEDEGGDYTDTIFHNFLGSKGMDYISFKVPFVTEINEATYNLLRHLPFLLQWEYDICESYLVGYKFKTNYKLNYVQLDVYYFKNEPGCFIEDSLTDSLYDDFMGLIKDEVRRRNVIC